MGTNYYWHSDTCEHCGRSDEPLHICKSYSIFRGHFTWDEEGEPHPALTSWADWKNFLTSKPGQIVDEYGDVHDTAEFIATVEAATKRTDERFNALAGHPYTVFGRTPGGDWADDEGYAFHGGEFS